MPLIEDINSNSYSIEAYDKNLITIKGITYHESIVLTATKIISPWPVSILSDLSEKNLEAIFSLEPDVVLLGTGEKQKFPDISIRATFAKHNLAVDVMTTGALCRTFNILVAEDRNVAAAIILGNK